MPSVSTAQHLWKPGVSANPLGRQIENVNRVQEKRFTNALLDVLKEPPDQQPKQRKTKLLTIVAKLVSMAANGDLNATKMIVDRIDGPVPIPYQGPTNAALASAMGTPTVLVVKWGSPAPVHEASDIPMLELKAVGSTVASTAASEGKPSDTKDLA